MFGQRRGYDHLLRAIEKCTSEDLLLNLLHLLSQPVQMLDSDWAMSYILRIFTALKAQTEFYSISYNKSASESIEKCLKALQIGIFSRSKGFNLEINQFSIDQILLEMSLRSSDHLQTLQNDIFKGYDFWTRKHEPIQIQMDLRSCDQNSSNFSRGLTGFRSSLGWYDNKYSS